ncbi:hypothetical protein GGQ74_002482 [Desulfobaculum xiamenense]|uniref:Uncharacterized protein n=1 Tax=Desulfobaculum xiamenense TaxID=995050 RepID=A0A846QW02_9BACT|nr:hypothetical protein [Desulfobaculum xiamenense]NJB68809.1 hypothetical protein [Desulfobaculum xiamenense]
MPPLDSPPATAAHVAPQRVTGYVPAMRRNISASMQLLPFMAFLFHIFSAGAGGTDWQLAFEWGGLAAVSVTAACLGLRLPVDRLLLGVNLYLASGAAAYAVQWFPMLGLYARLQAAGILAWVVAVGVADFLLLLRSKHADTCSQRRALRLLLTEFVALNWAFLFRDSHMLALVLPFATLAIMRMVLNRRFAPAMASGSTNETEAEA